MPIPSNYLLRKVNVNQARNFMISGGALLSSIYMDRDVSMRTDFHDYLNDETRTISVNSFYH